MQENHVPVLFTDLSAKHLLANLVVHARMKHVEINFHFILDLVLSKHLEVLFTPSQEQVTNASTKHLPEARITSLKTKLMVLP